DPGDARRPVGPQGSDRLMPVRVEQRPHPPRELRLGLLDIPPRRHPPMIAPIPFGLVVVCAIDRGQRGGHVSCPAGTLRLTPAALRMGVLCASQSPFIVETIITGLK